MATFTIDLDPETCTCCRCKRVDNMMPTQLTFDHDYRRPLDGTPSVRRWLCNGWQWPEGWKAAGGEMICPACWAEFLDFAKEGRA